MAEKEKGVLQLIEVVSQVVTPSHLVPLAFRVSTNVNTTTKTASAVRKNSIGCTGAVSNEPMSSLPCLKKPCANV